MTSYIVAYIVNRNNNLNLSLALVILLSMAAVAQSPVQSYELPRVYVVDFTQVGSDPHFTDLATFTAELIRLQLLEMPTLEVVRTATPPPCGETSGFGCSPIKSLWHRLAVLRATSF